jgi:hypothetical protein
MKVAYYPGCGEPRQTINQISTPMMLRRPNIAFDFLTSMLYYQIVLNQNIPKENHHEV